MISKGRAQLNSVAKGVMPSRLLRKKSLAYEREGVGFFWRGGVVHAFFCLVFSNFVFWGMWMSSSPEELEKKWYRPPLPKHGWKGGWRV